MNISEAIQQSKTINVKSAVRLYVDGFITRISWNNEKWIELTDCGGFFMADGSSWNPLQEDLTANDWRVIDDVEIEELFES